jgi:trans-2,3-dihydro-3-hydroxyanthranilate isomerase
MRRTFYTLDVFTDVALAGNPLAVVLDCDGLDAARMQAIAREFNLSETVFVLAPRNPVNTARLRIFTPVRELPFAGHPTVGAAILLAYLRAPELLVREDLRIVVEEGVGEIVCIARHRRGQAMAAYFALPRLPRPDGDAPPDESIAEALGLDVAEIGAGAHRPAIYDAGAPYLFVPVAGLAAIARARPDLRRWGADDEPAAYLYTDEVANAGANWHARMFAAGLGVPEDPATGSAAAAFAGVLMEFERPGDGEHMVVIEQGVEMGRPSTISLGIEVEHGALRAATIGGAAVIVSHGAVEL